jgi:hypothetical protein
VKPHFRIVVALVLFALAAIAAFFPSVAEASRLLHWEFLTTVGLVAFAAGHLP